MVQKRRKVVLHSQARNFVIRLQKYFSLEKINKGPLLPLDRVCERVAAALHLSTVLVVQITGKNKESNSKLLKPEVTSSEPHQSLDTKKKIFRNSKTMNSQPLSELKSNYMCSLDDIETSDVGLLDDPSFCVLKPSAFYQNDSKSIITVNDDPNLEINPELSFVKAEKLEGTANIQDTIDFKPNYDKSGNFIITDNAKATCKICHKTVVYRTRNMHIKKCHPSSDNRKMAKCDFCDQLFIDYKLNRHMILMHGKKCLKCAFCRSDFATKESLKDHISNCPKKRRQHITRPKELELVKCDFCDKEMQRGSLNTHKNKIHLGLAPVCEHCGKSFGNRPRLMDHCRAKHGYQKLECTRCDFKSSSQISLDNHLRKHDGIKPFICDKCGVGFHGAYLLKQHRKSHSTLKTYKCDECPSAFKSSNNLASHKSNCHNAAPFACCCGKRFSCKNTAKRHVKNQKTGKHEVEKCIEVVITGG